MCSQSADRPLQYMYGLRIDPLVDRWSTAVCMDTICERQGLLVPKSINALEICYRKIFLFEKNLNHTDIMWGNKLHQIIFAITLSNRILFWWILTLICFGEFATRRLHQSYLKDVFKMLRETQHMCKQCTCRRRTSNIVIISWNILNERL